MLKSTFLPIAEPLLALPTAPFREQAVQAHIKGFLKDRNIPFKADKRGNILAAMGKGRGAPALALTAHMDHPGFIIDKDSDKGLATALFYGGVEEEYFKNGRVRVYMGTGSVAARILRTKFDLKNHIKRAFLRVAGPVGKGDLGMWDLPAFVLKNGVLHARAHDDLAGCAVLMTLINGLAKHKPARKILFVFTVAEESGMHGAIDLCYRKTIPRATPIISLETSRFFAHAPSGSGVIIRVGDRISCFSNGMTAFMMDTAGKIAEKSKTFRFQRKLMDGGACESTVFQKFGYTAGAVTVPLGNYHNRNFEKKRIEMEYIALNDLLSELILLDGIIKNAGAIARFIRPKKPAYRLEERKLGEFFYHPE